MLNAFALTLLCTLSHDFEEPPRVEDTIPVELDGYCPVVLTMQKKWRKGDSQFEAVFENRRYFFVNQEHLATFQNKPARYAPYRSGLDIVSIRDEMRRQPGKRRHGVFYKDRIYLFASEMNLQKFWKSPDEYVEYAHAHPDRTARSNTRNQ